MTILQFPTPPPEAVSLGTTWIDIGDQRVRVFVTVHEARGSALRVSIGMSEDVWVPAGSVEAVKTPN